MSSVNEVIQVLLPKALDLGNTEVGSRQYDLTIFTKISNYYTDLTIHRIRTIPNFAPVQIHVLKDGAERGRYGIATGIMDDMNLQIDRSGPVTLRLFNLSIDTDVMFSIITEGQTYAV